MTECVFCKKISINDYNFIYEFNNRVLVHEINPVSNFHCILFSKQHIEDIKEASDDIVSELGSIFKKVVFSIKKVDNNIKNVSIISLNFNLKHIHFHLIPIYNNENPKKIDNYNIDGSWITYLSYKEIIQDSLKSYIERIYWTDSNKIFGLMENLLKGIITKNSLTLKNTLKNL